VVAKIVLPEHLLLVASDVGASVEAIEVIYRERFHRFVRVAQAITRSRETAVDAAQDAFASVLRNRHGYRGSGTVEAWVWSSVVNAARQAVRAPAGVPLIEVGGPDRLVGGMEADGVRSVIASLPERQRLVLFLRYYADLDYRAIADALALEVGTVGATLNQAHRNLRRLLAEVSD
jgi:RNA polymerase sigma factor (sigma-70 family)